VTVSCLVPTAIQALLNHPATRATDFSSLRSLIYAGSPISVEVLSQAIDTFGCEMSQFYGSTEMWIVTLLRPEQHQPTRPHTLASCGSPMAGVQIRIVGPDGEDVPDGSVGELWVRSPTAFAGYYNQPETTAAAMTDGWYRTGDVGRRDAEGLYYVVDRLKDMIITGGENVYSIEVERALGSHPDVSGAAAIGVPDTRWGEAVTAFVTLRSGNTTTADELREFCRELIAAYKIPKSIAIVQELPMTPSGKVRKAALRALAESQRVAASGQATP